LRLQWPDRAPYCALGAPHRDVSRGLAIFVAPSVIWIVLRARGNRFILWKKFCALSEHGYAASRGYRSPYSDERSHLASHCRFRCGGTLPPPIPRSTPSTYATAAAAFSHIGCVGGRGIEEPKTRSSLSEQTFGAAKQRAVCDLNIASWGAATANTNPTQYVRLLRYWD
jgi:hypothetical protein